AGLVDLENVAVDGTKVLANASRQKTFSAMSASKREEKLKARVAQILAEAEAIDKAEDEKYRDRSTYQLPKELRNREARLKKIQEWKEKREKEEKAKEEEKAAEKAKKKPPRRPQDPHGKSKQAKQLKRNLTDYDSRIMHLMGGNWAQCFNAQA